MRMRRLAEINARLWPFATIALLTVVTVLSLSPLPQLPGPTGGDKLHHFVAYSALAFPAAFAGARNWPAVILALAVWSGLIEVVQPYVNRWGEWADFAANLSGLALGALAGMALRRSFQ